MSNNTRDTFAALRLEIRKRSVYKEHLGEERRLTRKQGCKSVENHTLGVSVIEVDQDVV